ncbi:MAG: hypothetical protein HY537_12155 [Deltaproteobacteria bacterium]|nr:hypothetical protein [Deltaproteobacteria bacterium]
MLAKPLPNEKFKFALEDLGGKHRINLQGTIDEDTKFDDMKNITTPIIFNFKGVGTINSCGVRSWVNFIKELSNLEVTYEDCPPVIVRQLNMIPSFRGHAQVVSVYIPYICASCDTEKMVLVPHDQWGSVNPVIMCDNCAKEEMEFDGDPEQYFAFSK